MLGIFIKSSEEFLQLTLRKIVNIKDILKDNNKIDCLT